MIAMEMSLELGVYASIKCADTTELGISYGYACHWDIRRSHVLPPPPPATSHQPREPQPIKHIFYDHQARLAFHLDHQQHSIMEKHMAV
jgi:hypothetical protein